MYLRICRAALAIVVWSVVVSLGVACGRTSLWVAAASDAGSVAVEQCNRRDDDGDTRVDEDFRDALGRYVSDAHCGSCEHDCGAPLAHATAQGCGLIAEAPACVARRCERGYGVSQSGRCVSLSERLCLPCASDRDCGSLASARCLISTSGGYCTTSCDSDCPDGYTCRAGICSPARGDCACSSDDAAFTRGCVLSAPDGSRCVGHQACARGGLSACAPAPELCDGEDNDCDGIVDEDFVDARGAYSLDDANCGACGVDCAQAAPKAVALSCGGDPFAPSCVLACGEAGAPLQPGDRVDADRRVDTGCECIVRSLTDAAGGGTSSAAGGDTLDANCDGADGDVRSSYYVATDGDDAGPGSPTRPLRSIAQAVTRAADSLASAAPRPDVFVASGSYTEVVHVRDGVRVHGGYRHDFQALDPDGFEVLIAAPPQSELQLGAALVFDAAGSSDTLVENLRVRGFDATDASQPAVGVLVRDPGPRLTLRALRVQTGKPRTGATGADGSAAGPVVMSAGPGQNPRAAREDAAHACVAGSNNQTVGGAAGRNQCAGTDVSGGDGASAGCPRFSQHAATGGSGLGPAAGDAGEGGTDVSAPVTDRSVCDSVCCGLADFTVPPVYQQATPGVDGANGRAGQAGDACSDALGSFGAAGWLAGLASDGSAGAAGSGGGGGGAGGGVEFGWFAGVCEFADGLGGAGGGGGAGGCGGGGGVAGQSAAPAVGVLVQASARALLPRFEQLSIETEVAGSGGDGGHGGDGALGGRGGSGGALARAELSTPTSAGAAAGERGGNGGPGGAGGAGGGGCGGSSVGIWIAGLASDAQLLATWRAANSFALGAAGRAGRGGGGAVRAADGAAGSAIDVLFR
jgi:hypothetical protein